MYDTIFVSPTATSFVKAHNAHFRDGSGISGSRSGHFKLATPPRPAEVQPAPINSPSPAFGASHRASLLSIARLPRLPPSPRPRSHPPYLSVDHLLLHQRILPTSTSNNLLPRPAASLNFRRDLRRLNADFSEHRNYLLPRGSLHR